MVREVDPLVLLDHILLTNGCETIVDSWSGTHPLLLHLKHTGAHTSSHALTEANLRCADYKHGELFMKLVPGDIECRAYIPEPERI